jgi:hypothetical protein
VAEACRSIDVNRLNRDGCLAPGWNGYWHWQTGDETVSTIGIKAEIDRLILSYNFRRHQEEWQAVEQAILIIRNPCPFGGSRPYILCPGAIDGAGCGRRVIKLYGPDKHFLCRHCYRLSYASQREDRLDRTRRRASRIRRRLDPGSSLRDPAPERPKGMWQRTYLRLSGELKEAEAEAQSLYVQQLKGLIERFDRSIRTKGVW